MLVAINIENAHRHGDAMPQLFRLRYRQFKERQNYDVRVFKDMEYDEYDTPETTYLVWRDADGHVGGTSRLNPTTCPYMLKDLWADMIEGHDLPCSSDAWEGTRICINKALPGKQRERIKWEIVLGYLEFGLATGIRRYVGIMQNFIWTRVFIQSGWGAEFLGPEKLIDGIPTHAGQVHVSPEALQRVREKTGIFDPVLVNRDEVSSASAIAA